MHINVTPYLCLLFATGEHVHYATTETLHSDITKVAPVVAPPTSVD